MGLLGSTLLLGNILYLLFSRPDLFSILIGFATIAGLIVVIKFSLWQITHSKNVSQLYLPQDQEGFVAVSFDESLLGKAGVAETSLALSGSVRVDGKKVAALSRSGFIEKGDKVVVIGGQGSHIIVKKVG